MTHELAKAQGSHDDHDDHLHDHDHDHDHHDHPTTWWGRIAHGALELFGAGHSHDAADQVDEALEADSRGRRALWLSLAALAVTALLQAVVVVLTGSVALLGDTLHNVADAVTALPLLVAFWLARKPSNDRYTYGYGRAEDLAGLFVVAMIALSSALAGYEAIRRLLDPQRVDHLWAVAAAGVIGFAGNELVARYRIRVGRQIGSAALVADGLHARTDGFTSLAVVIGAAGVAVGLPWADPVVGLLIAIAILGVLRSAIAQVGARLMDAVSPDLVPAAREAIGTVEGIVSVESVRLRWIGHSLHADAEVVVPAGISVAEGHDIAHHAEAHLLERLPRLHSAVIHVGPAASPSD
ncbi:MAG: cation diffusion facilitator family transporter [Angustibacter sp.]